MQLGMGLEVAHFKNSSELSKASASLVSQMAKDAVEKRGLFTFVLSGGHTPKPLYELFSREPYLSQMPWKDVHLFWGDERFVDQNHQENNFWLAHSSFISKVPIPDENVHPISTDADGVELAAIRYEKEIRTFFGSADPVFDLMLMGIGPDGHTASLFPGSYTLDEKEKYVVSAEAPPDMPVSERITMTLPIINMARNALFLVSDETKKNIVDLILKEPDKAIKLYPSALVSCREKTIWYLGFL
ncbi:MAG: 6-phosphogluconolactonase [Pseudomonadota bacterium]